MVGDDDCVYMLTIGGRERVTSSTDGSTTCSWTPRCSMATARWAYPV